MASINEKLNYINETKSLIKDKLNDLGSEINNETTFREYSNRIENLYEEWPKVNNQGSDLTILNNTKKGKLKLNIEGNLKQFSTEGRNLFNYLFINEIGNGTIEGDTITSTINETSQGKNINVYFYNHPIAIPANSTVYFSADIKLNKNSTGTFGNLNDGVHAQTKKPISPTLSTSYQKYQTSLSYDEATNIDKMLIQFFGLTGTVSVKNVMISLTSDIGYEPYTGGQPAPSENYPQEINTSTNNCNITILGKNLTDFENPSGYYNCTYDRNTKVYQSNTLNSNYAGMNLYVSNTPITIYPNSNVFNTFYYSADIRILDGEYNNNLNLIRTGSNNLNVSATINAINNPVLTNSFQRYVFKVSYNNHNETNITDNNCFIQIKTGASNLKLEVKNVMISLSDNYTYLPYNNQNYSISLNDMELCKVNEYRDYLYKDNNKWYKKPIILKILEYHNEIITTPYKSTTGQLTEGATVYYVNPIENPDGILITDSILTNQLNQIEKYSNSYDIQTNIFQTTEKIPLIINATALMKNSD